MHCAQFKRGPKIFRRGPKGDLILSKKDTKNGDPKLRLQGDGSQITFWAMPKYTHFFVKWGSHIRSFTSVLFQALFICS